MQVVRIKRNAILTFLIIAFMLSSQLIHVFAEKEVAQYTFATGPTGGTFFPLGGIISQNWNDKLAEDVHVTTIVTAAGLENLRLLKDEEAAFAFLPESISYFGYTETGVCEGLGEKFNNFSVLGKIYPEPVQIVVKKDSNYNVIADLKGKTVSVGARGGYQHLLGLQVFELAGLPQNNFTASFTGYAAAADQLIDGQIEGMFFLTGLPNSTVIQLAASPGIKLIPIDDVTIEKIQKEVPFANKLTIPANAYSSQDYDVQTISIWSLLLVRNDIPEDLVYKLTKTLFESSKELGEVNIQAGWIDINEQKDLSLPFHPGAQKYFEEANN